MNARRAGLRRNVFACAAFGLALSGCGPGRVADGGGSEAGNAIVAGRLVDAKENPSAGVTVRAFRDDFDPVLDNPVPACPEAVTDSAGYYRLACKDTVRLRLSGKHPSQGTLFLLNGVRPSRGETLDAPTMTLRTPGGLRVILPERGATLGSYVYVPGTPLFARVDSAALREGSFLLDSVPAGLLESVRFVTLGAPGYLELGTNVQVADTGVTTLSPYHDWAHSRRVRIDLQSIAGGIGGNAIAFPLLVRLGAAELDFSQARPDGGDIRFAKPDGTPLAFEIEEWNPAASQAAVWVRMDTVYSDNRGQIFTLFWGNPQPSTPAGTRPVFDTAEGFSGVWHLNESKDSSHTPGVYRDATPGGTAADDYITSSKGMGVIGNALDLRGRMWVEVPKPLARMKAEQALTVSAWVKMDSIDDSGSTILALGTAYSLVLRPDSTIRLNVWNGTDYDWAWTHKLAIGDGRWYHIAAIFDYPNIEIMVDSSNGVRYSGGPIVYAGSDPMFRIGNFVDQGDDFDFFGGIDEVQVSRVARSDGWVRLSHAVENIGSTVLVWLP